MDQLSARRAKRRNRNQTFMKAKLIIERERERERERENTSLKHLSDQDTQALCVFVLPRYHSMFSLRSSSSCHTTCGSQTTTGSSQKWLVINKHELSLLQL